MTREEAKELLPIIIQIDSILFPEVKWSDGEPTKVKLVIEK